MAVANQNKDRVYNLSQDYITISKEELLNSGVALTDIIDIEKDEIMVLATTKDQVDIERIAIFDPKGIQYKLANGEKNKLFRYFNTEDYLTGANVAVYNTNSSETSAAQLNKVASEYHLDEVLSVMQTGLLVPPVNIAENSDILLNESLDFLFVNLFVQEIENIEMLYIDFYDSNTRNEVLSRIDSLGIMITYPKTETLLFASVLASMADKNIIIVFEFIILISVNILYFLIAIIHSSHYKEYMEVNEANNINVKQYILLNTLMYYIVAGGCVYFMIPLLSDDIIYYLNISYAFVKLSILYLIVHIVLANRIYRRYGGTCDVK